MIDEWLDRETRLIAPGSGYNVYTHSGATAQSMATAVHLPIIGWISIAGFLLVATLATRNIYALWRDPSQEWRWPDWWVRGLPVAVTLGWAFVLAAALTIVGMSSSGTIADIFVVLLLVVLLSIALCAFVWIGVITINRPKFAVPPHLRDQPGVFGRGDEDERPRQTRG